MPAPQRRALAGQRGQETLRRAGTPQPAVSRGPWAGFSAAGPEPVELQQARVMGQGGQRQSREGGRVGKARLQAKTQWPAVLDLGGHPRGNGHRHTGVGALGPGACADLTPTTVVVGLVPPCCPQEGAQVPPCICPWAACGRTACLSVQGDSACSAGLMGLWMVSGGI